jgi:hypothetical protein
MMNKLMVPVIAAVAIIAGLGHGSPPMVGLALTVGFLGLVAAALAERMAGRR